jgi:2,3-dihydroxybenzoate decarboxylase
MKIIALEESFWYEKLATEGNTARAWLRLKSAVAADWQRKLVDFTDYRLPDMDRNGVGYARDDLDVSCPAGSH